MTANEGTAFLIALALLISLGRLSGILAPPGQPSVVGGILCGTPRPDSPPVTGDSIFGEPCPSPARRIDPYTNMERKRA